MIILGIDPGSHITGYGFVDSHEKNVSLKEAGVVKPSSKLPLMNRIHSVYHSLEKLIDEIQPDVMVLEKLYAHHRHPATAPVIGHVRGVICLLCAQKSIELVEYSVKRVRKAVTGNGSASKNQTKRFVSSVLGVDEEKLTLDASDALALALAHHYMI